MVYFPTFGWFLGHMLVNTSGIPYMEHSGICWYANMTMKQKIGGMPIFLRALYAGFDHFQSVSFWSGHPSVTVFEVFILILRRKTIYFSIFRCIFRWKWNPKPTTNCGISGIFGLTAAGDMIPQGIPNIVYADVYWQYGCYFFLYKMAGVNPLHKTFYVMVFRGYSPAIL